MSVSRKIKEIVDVGRIWMIFHRVMGAADRMLLKLVPEITLLSFDEMWRGF